MMVAIILSRVKLAEIASAGLVKASLKVEVARLADYLSVKNITTKFEEQQKEIREKLNKSRHMAAMALESGDWDEYESYLIKSIFPNEGDTNNDDSAGTEEGT
jgi:hypothetical protein